MHVVTVIGCLVMNMIQNFPQIPGLKEGLKIWLDRLQLLNILDQDRDLVFSLSCVLLSVLVAFLGSLVLQQQYYTDLWLVLFCLVLCSCQYSLLKSVQPDASSPTHGFNPMTVFSRPIYFCLCCSMVLTLQVWLLLIYRVCLCRLKISICY